jgi:hypothetical protein
MKAVAFLHFPKGSVSRETIEAARKKAAANGIELIEVPFNQNSPYRPSVELISLPPNYLDATK